MTITKLEIPVICQDGTRISTTQYMPETITEGHILLAGATGVPQGFYTRFAQYAVAKGFAVRTLDYRGVGASAPKTLRGYRMNYLDWGRQDLSATLEDIEARNPSQAIFMLGHSYGGHGFGLMPNHHKVKKFYTFASGAGWSGHMPQSERFKVWLMWNVIGPISVPLLGYMHGKVIGGENLPRDVFYQWKRWCQFPHYFFDDPTMINELAQFELVRTPIKAANALDDAWAMPTSRDHFFKGYKNAPCTTVDIDPTQFGAKGIGHMGYFRRGSERLWDDALDWFIRLDKL